MLTLEGDPPLIPVDKLLSPPPSQINVSHEAQATQTEVPASFFRDDQLLELLYQCLGGRPLGGPGSRWATPAPPVELPAAEEEETVPPEGEELGDSGT